MTTANHQAPRELDEQTLYAEGSPAGESPVRPPPGEGIPRHRSVSPSLARSTSPAPESDSQESVHKATPSSSNSSQLEVIPDSDPELDDDEEEMSGTRPAMHRPTDGRSQQPLLADTERGRPSYDAPNGSARPALLTQRSSRFRSHSPDLEGKSATRKKYTYAAIFLIISLISFTVQTETAKYIQDTLGWKKAYCML